MSDKLPPTRKKVPREWGQNALDRIFGDRKLGPMEGAVNTGGALLAGIMDLFAPKTVPQDVELPNPGGWATTDPRIKEKLLGYDPTNPPLGPRRIINKR